MRARGVIFAVTVAAAVTGQAVAAENSDSTVVQGLVIQGRLPHEVQGLIITPGRVCLKARKPPDPDVPEPKLVSTFPADGAVVKPGIIILRLTFDLPMACQGLIDSGSSDPNPFAGSRYPNPCPAPLIDPVISKDRRTFLTVCVVQPNLHYDIWLNRRPEFRWTSLAGHPIRTRELTFITSDGKEKVRTVHDAIAEDPFLKSMVEQGK